MLGGDLAIIKSAAENNFIFTLLKKQKTITGLGVWLGFVRKADNSSTGLMTLHWRKVTLLGQAANQTMLVGMKSVETCLARHTAMKASGTTYLAISIRQVIGSTLQLSFARKSKLGDLRPLSRALCCNAIK